MNSPRHLFLFTICYPYGTGETFLANEFPYLLKNFSGITIVTAFEGTETVSVPENVRVVKVAEMLAGQSRIKYLLLNLPVISQIMLHEFFRCPSKSHFLRQSRRYLSELINACICAAQIERMKSFEPTAAFYSFWMNNHALTLSILKKKKRIERFIFRVHGFDLVLERWPSRYIPFQNTCHKMADRILTVSQKTLGYLKLAYKNYGNAGFCYLGSEDRGFNPTADSTNKLRIVSCSSIIPLKRLHLIAEVLSFVNIETEWIHFGEGKLQTKISEQCKDLPPHIKVFFKGQVAQQELFHYYSNHRIDFFINVSETEGLPFSVIEAVSFGIPVIATNVGGTSEIVNKKTGILLDVNFNPHSVAAALNNINDSRFRDPGFRDGAKKFWRENFYAGKVYPEFIQNNLLVA